MNPANLCSLAVSFIDAYGWTQEVYENKDGNLCIIGALRKAAHGDAHTTPLLQPSYPQAVQALVVQAALLDQLSALPEWNDHPDRTKEEVTTLLRTTAQHLRETPDETV